MCFGKRNEISDDPPPRPAQNYQNQSNPSSTNDTKMTNFASNNPYHSRPGNAASGQQEYAPPPGPPPSQQHHQQSQGDFAPPAGPPPSHKPQPPQDEYAPPAGPPPSKGRDNTSWIAPPQDGPSSAAGSSQQHNWEAAVPDTSQLPPPPALFNGYDRSPANNATEDESNAGEAWCAQNPLRGPIQLDAAGEAALRANNFCLVEPPGFRGQTTWKGAGSWAVTSPRGCSDSTLISWPPQYVVSEHDPTRTGRRRTIYYEVKADRCSDRANLALGYTAMPYPGFRLPGWHRGSLAVHGDDGHRYVNDTHGGKDFTKEFVRGETHGVGMVIAQSEKDACRASVEVFFTRNGKRVGGWNIHEETDSNEDKPVTGLEGFHDLYAAVGMFEDTEFEVVFDPAKWLYKGVKNE
ncbi:SPla/RYanodine receptor SPRY [Cordyceps fumosorosea ARSEF 2679]|uniref:SPla/RYanodine receptor SPRY n=1 Tax=Cordyceps fumosorosea (strain ARSEF 2679) TaxID=1081104 RepID=A0A168AIU6_CORFA|nr:SPla/RYanodine receptor SPRY [Cordyceps fumosorosea ARSEF 2679]OAA68806.1 SPla/RYanodine receptor SPRY [Cordyceps fumosorosea ARSEF 2679]